MARVNKDYMDKFFEYGVDLDSRTMYINDISEKGVENILKGLHLLELAAPNGDKPINIILNNDGGTMYVGMAIYDRIRACQNKVIITVFGQAESMGCILLQAGDKRILAPHARIMFHEGKGELAEDTYDNIEAFWAEEKRYGKIVDDILLNRIREKHPQFKESAFRKMNKVDQYLSAEKAVELGLADEVLKIS